MLREEMDPAWTTSKVSILDRLARPRHLASLAQAICTTLRRTPRAPAQA
ncbi:hypothetical protein [Nocardia gipuzkoensis]|nr:hypothetical protein [Nocardia gipuzkoensis]